MNHLLEAEFRNDRRMIFQGALGALGAVSSLGMSAPCAKAANTIFFVDSTAGNDANNGTSMATPWKTLTNVNNTTFAPGTQVQFKRGGVWRGQIKVSSSGSSGSGMITYGAYGSGAHPLFLGSVDASSTSAWTLKSGNIWQTVAKFPPKPGYTNGTPYNAANDIGNIIFLTAPTASGGTATGTGFAVFNATKQTVGGTPTAQGQWNFNMTTWRVELYSTSNPGSFYRGIELAIDQSGVIIYRKSYNCIKDLEFRYYAGNTIMGQPCTYCIIQGCLISWAGGGNLGGFGTRYGDSIAFLDNCTNCLVEGNWIYQSYDGGLVAVQGINSGDVIHDITCRNNIVWMSDAAEFSAWSRGSSSLMYNIFVYNNTFVGTSRAWDQNQRPNGNQNFGISNPSSSNLIVSNLVYENNAFVDINGCAILGNNFTQWKGNWKLNYNLWGPGTCGNVPTFCAQGLSNENLSTWAASYPAEKNGLINVAPQFVNQATGNFTPASGSPLRNAGKNLYSAGVVVDFYGNPRPSSGAFTIGAVQ
jgi:hypothetical protein